MPVTPAKTRVPWWHFNPRGCSLLYRLFYPRVSPGTGEFKTSKDWMKISSVNSQPRIHNQWKCPSAMNTELMTSQRKENWEDLLLADLPKEWKPLKWNPRTAERKVKMTLKVLNDVGWMPWWRCEAAVCRRRSQVVVLGAEVKIQREVLNLIQTDRMKILRAVYFMNA